MPSARRRSRPGRAAAALLALLALAGGCATPGRDAAAPSQSPLEVYRALLGRNAGLGAVRAVAEVRVAYAGREATFPGVLLLDSYQGFRLELLDPLDRPMAILFDERGRIVQYRPAQHRAASLGLFPAECRGVRAGDWVGAVIASSLGPVAGERLEVRRHWGGERSLERRRDGELQQRVRFRVVDGEPLPRVVTWHCADEPVLRLWLRDWVGGAPGWRLPSRLDVDYPGAGLSVRIELREVEGNPPPTGRPLRPPIGDDVDWTTWNLPR